MQDSTYTIAQEITIQNQNQLVVIDEQLISVSVLTGRDARTNDSTIVDTNDINFTVREPVIIIDSYTGAQTLKKGTKGDPIFGYKFHSNVNLKEFSYYTHDHLGNTRVVYTPKIISCTEPVSIIYTLDYAGDYYPYGKILREFNPKAEKYMSTHHERDTETGLDYRGARYYDADIARFLSLDPAAVKYPTLSDYAYVAGNPIIFIDPTGKVIDYAGGARRDVRRARRASRNGNGAFEASFQAQRASSDLFIYSKVGSGSATTKYATNPETSFTANRDGSFTPRLGSSQTHGSTNEGDNTKDETVFRFTGRPSESVGVNQVIGAVPKADGTVSATSANQYTSGTIQVTGAGDATRTRSDGATLEVIVTAGGKEIYRAPLPLIPVGGAAGNTLVSPVINFTVNNRTGNSKINVKIRASDAKSANAGSVKVDIINDVQ